MGLRLALGPLRVLAYVEREAFALAVLADAISKGYLPDAPFRSDCRTFDARPLCGRVDVLTGGYPCQPFSVAGRRRGEKDPRHLWPAIERIVRECRPGICFFENVANHLNIGFDVVLRSLQGMGYEVAAGLFTAEEVGATHGRERLFILAHASGGQRSPGGKIERGDSRPRPSLRDDHRPGTDVGDVARGGLTRRRLSARSRPKGQGAADACGADEAMGSGGQELADVDGLEQGCECAGTPQGQSPQEDCDGGRGLPLFPPGRWYYDTEIATAVSRPASRREAVEAAFACLHSDWRAARAWEAVGKARRDLLPAAPQSVVCRMAPGVAGRVDRISVLGNSVVPLQAAYAFCTLWASLRGRAFE